jgi:DNA-binding LytR/AlgR family response regulator
MAGNGIVISVLLADDEPVALERLRLAIACIPDAKLVAAARNGLEALQMMREYRPDIAVLDIQMPGKDGFAVIEALEVGDHLPEIVFVTAFHRYAVQAFEANAVDYLLKPVDFDRFRESIVRAKARLNARSADARFSELQQLIACLQASGSADETSGYTREVWVRTHASLVRVQLQDVDWIEAEGDYVSLHTVNRTYLLKNTMASLQEQLDPSTFARVHRSAIVNLSRVERVYRRGRRSISLVLATGQTVAVGPSYASVTLEALNAKRWRRDA